MSHTEYTGAGRLPLLYSRTATGAINTWQCWVEGPEVVTEWGQQGGQMQVARFTCEPKNPGKKNGTTAEQQAVKEAISQHKKKLKAKYNDSLESAGETKRIKPMLAQDAEKRKGKIKFPVYVQPKLDGLRAIALRDESGKVVLQSRGGEFYNLRHIQEELNHYYHDDVPLDGELYIHGVSLQAVNQLVRGQREDMWRIQYHVYDMVEENVPYEQRMEKLLYTEGLFIHSSSIYRCDALKACSEEDVRQMHANFVRQGFEGAILRTPTGLYREGYRSPDLLKVKSWKDAEFVIHSWARGKGKFENVPTFKCLIDPSKPPSEENTFDATPKGTEDERAGMLAKADSMIGKLMKVKFFDYSPYGKPLYPVALGLRDRSDLS